LKKRKSNPLTGQYDNSRDRQMYSEGAHWELRSIEKLGIEIGEKDD
jgi:hypothetical protein